ncbi:hypothetical protein GvMRE_I1g737 [endosymbiont GvMRE of Glomus versiforme]|nr:hypothetical protein GvMRE_I1g737 [endosymbiont GvMRE of Glomus versiforme]
MSSVLSVPSKKHLSKSRILQDLKGVIIRLDTIRYISKNSTKEEVKRRIEWVKLVG